MAVIDWIIAERKRQIEKEGWTTEHDDTHRGYQLSLAGACYAAAAAGEPAIFSDVSGREELWPWDSEWDKRKKHSTVQNLVIACALILAELERLERMSERRSIERAISGADFGETADNTPRRKLP